MNPFPRRRQNAQRLLREHKVDALLITHPLNVAYLSGFTGGSSFLLIGPKRTILVSDTRFTLQIGEECAGLETSIRGHNKTTWQQAAEVATKLGYRAIGLESAHVSLADFDRIKELAPTINFAGLAGLIESLRAIKDATEIAAIREAIGFGQRAFEMFRAMLAPGDTEKQMADALDCYINRAGGHGMGFDTIVAVGDRSALPHCPPSSRRLEEADFLLIDWGAKGARYTSDLTRTIRSPFALERRGRQRVESKLQKIYTVVLQAQARAIAAVRPGAHAKDVDAAARSVIADAGYGRLFDHGLGHGIGLNVHEAPDIRSTSAAVLRPGMVFTIEPGVYLPGVGGVRLEDDVLVTPDGCEILSASVPKMF